MPQPTADGATLSAPAAERVKDVHAAGLTRRREPGQKARNEADSGGEQEHAHVNRRLERVTRRSVRAKHAHEDLRQTEAERAARRRQQYAFRQELSCDSTRAGAQRPPHRNFTGAGDAAGKEQSGDVGRRDQEHKGHHSDHTGHERPRNQLRVGVERHLDIDGTSNRKLRSTDTVDELLRYAAADRRRSLSKSIESHLRECRRESRNGRFQARERRTVLDPPDRRPPAVCIAHCGAGHPEVCRRQRIRDATEAASRQADDRGVLVVDPNLSAKHFWICLKPPYPQCVADDDDRRDRRVFVCGADRPADRGTDTEQSKVVARHCLARFQFGVAVCRENSRQPRVRGIVSEGTRLAPQQVQFVVTQRRCEQSTLRRPLIDVEELVRCWYRERREEQRVDHAEERRVGADAKRQDQHHGQRERRPAAHEPSAVFHVLPDRGRHGARQSSPDRRE